MKSTILEGCEMSKADNLCRERKLFELHDYAKELERKIAELEATLENYKTAMMQIFNFTKDTE